MGKLSSWTTKKFLFFISILALSSVCLPSLVLADTYHLEIGESKVTIAGRSGKKITVNNQLPAPTLHFHEGEDVTIVVTNHLPELSSIHWHGLLVPGNMDGVPGLNGFRGIAPGETFTYQFKIRQAGTYWYHAHSMGQEQDGLYGAIQIDPAAKPQFEVDRDYIVLLSEFTPESSTQILHNLKSDSSYYNYSQLTVKDFVREAKNKGLKEATENALDWGQMRMSPTDLSDVSGYTFLMNGKTKTENWTGIFKPGEKVLLRFINASAMSIFDIRIPGLKMKFVEADGQEIEPVEADEFRLGIAETYNVIVEPNDDNAYSVVAEPIDRTDFAIGTLAPREGMRGPMPEHRPRALLTMADMTMAPNMSAMRGHAMNSMGGKSGWGKMGAPKGSKILRYSDLRFMGTQLDTRPPTREIVVTLGGSMERYIWTMNGKTHDEAEPFHLDYGERVRITFRNESMMAHPMHIHGMFMQLENGQPPEKMPNKHTVIVPPGKTRSVLLTASESGEWAFHCHLLYHMLSGMMTTVIVDKAEKRYSSAHEHEHFDSLRLETDAGVNRDGFTTSWDLDGWVGGERHKLWLKAEGEVVDGKTDQSEFWAMYSKNIGEFWDAQIGFRYDIDPASRSYLVGGFDGLAQYFFESELHLFLSDRGDVSVRLREENDILFTQRLISQPYAEVNFFAQDVDDEEVGAGLSNFELGLQTRYELTRKFAPYLDLRYEQKVGETSLIAHQQGEISGNFIASVGMRLGF